MSISIGELSQKIKDMTNEVETLGSIMSKKELHQLSSALRTKMKSIHETRNIHKTFERDESKKSEAVERFTEICSCKHTIEHHKRITPYIPKKESVHLRIVRFLKNILCKRVSSQELYDLYHPFSAKKTK